MEIMNRMDQELDVTHKNKIFLGLLCSYAYFKKKLRMRFVEVPTFYDLAGKVVY